MKKLISILLALVFVLSVGTISVFAEEANLEDAIGREANLDPGLSEEDEGGPSRSPASPTIYISLGQYISQTYTNTKHEHLMA